MASSVSSIRPTQNHVHIDLTTRLLSLSKFRRLSFPRADSCSSTVRAHRKPFNLATSLQGSGRGFPRLRTSDEHSFIVRVLRARRAPGRSLPILLRPRVARAKETNGLPLAPTAGGGARRVGTPDRRQDPLSFSSPELTLFLLHPQIPTAASAEPRRSRLPKWSAFQGQNAFSPPPGCPLSSMQLREYAIAGGNPWGAHHIPVSSTAPRSLTNWQRRTQRSLHTPLSLLPVHCLLPAQPSSVPCSRQTE